MENLNESFVKRMVTNELPDIYTQESDARFENTEYLNI